MTAAYPLKWPTGWSRTPDADRRNSAVFAVTFDRALSDLYDELGKLGAESIVVSSWLQLGRRGEPLSGNSRSRLPDPGVAVYFFRAGKEYVLAQDAFDTVLGNTRSVGLALQGLRQLERHGGAHLAERAFGGFAALPPPPPPKKPWREVLGLVGLASSIPGIALAAAEAAYKTLAKQAHPDAGGKPGDMAELNEAIAEAREELKA